MKNLSAYAPRVMAAYFMLLFAFNGLAQNKPHLLGEEPIAIKEKKHSPTKATLYSMALPGLGQAYNKKYWKIPIVYAGLGTTIYFIIWNTQYYNEYATAFDIREAGGTDKYSGIYSSQNLITLQNYYRNNRDLSVILTVLVYGLNILDANIDAHLYSFDVSDDLSMRIEPAVLGRSFYGGLSTGLSFTLNF